MSIEQLAKDLAISFPDTLESAGKKLSDALQGAFDDLEKFKKAFQCSGVIFTDRQRFIIQRMIKKQKGFIAYQRRYKNHAK